MNSKIKLFELTWDDLCPDDKRKVRAEVEKEIQLEMAQHRDPSVQVPRAIRLKIRKLVIRQMFDNFEIAF